MRQLGWSEGSNLRIEARYGNNPTELNDLAADLVAMKVDLLVTESTPATRAALRATDTIPIVFEIGTDPVANGLVATLSRPGRNATGYTFGLYEEKLVEILKSALPRVTRVGFADDVVRARAVARGLGIEMIKLDLPSAEHIAGLFATARQRGAEAVIIPNVPLLNSVIDELGRASLTARMPTISWNNNFARAGGLLAFGPVVSEGWPRIASLIDRILKGANPGELPVEQPSKSQLIINLATAKTLGITIPPALLLRADEVIE
jgi:putative ABC transport system substrate-binding protein